MAMDADERRLLDETVEALGALTFVLGATLQLLNKDLKTLKPRLHYLLGATSAQALAPVVAGDTARMIQMAGEFIDMI